MLTDFCSSIQYVAHNCLYEIEENAGSASVDRMNTTSTGNISHFSLMAHLCKQAAISVDGINTCVYVCVLKAVFILFDTSYGIVIYTVLLLHLTIFS